jgi:DNA-binding response OmpR family regulator
VEIPAGGFTLGEKISVMIIGGSPDMDNRLKSDLELLGFKPLPGSFPDMAKGISDKLPGVILLDLTVGDNNARSVYEHFLRENNPPSETKLVAMLSETTIGQIPMEYNFADIIRLPYNIAELNFRLRRVISQNHREFSKDTISIGNLSVSPSEYEVKVGGRPVVLSHIEYELLKYLITHPNRVFTRERLLANIWNGTLESGSRTVDVHIRRVRAKIGDLDETYIKTIRGVGYAFRFNNG